MIPDHTAKGDSNGDAQEGELLSAAVNLTEVMSYINMDWGDKYSLFCSC